MDTHQGDYEMTEKVFELNTPVDILAIRQIIADYLEAIKSRQGFYDHKIYTDPNGDMWVEMYEGCLNRYDNRLKSCG